jgi:glycosyltransferase involved in cell wall biosynthesis
VRYVFRADDPDRRRASPLTRPHALYRVLHEIRPDVVHVNGLVFPAQVAELRWRLPAATPIVVLNRGERPHNWRLILAQRLVRRWIDGFLFTTDAIADEWRHAGVIGRRQAVLSVLATSSSLGPRPRGDARQRTAVHGTPAVLWVGRLHPRKSPLVALDAFDRARGRLDDPQLFVIFQENQLLEEMRAVCASRPGLTERVHFVGRVAHADLADWFSAADLFVTSSPAEGSNVALLESLSCGLLPVCSDNPANRFATADGEAGLLFPRGDATRAADALIDAAARVVGAGEAGRAALRAHFEARLGWPIVARQALAAYRTVVAGRARRR